MGIYLGDIVSVGVGSSELVIQYYETKAGMRVCKLADVETPHRCKPLFLFCPSILHHSRSRWWSV